MHGNEYDLPRGLCARVIACLGVVALARHHDRHVLRWIDELELPDSSTLRPLY